MAEGPWADTEPYINGTRHTLFSTCSSQWFTELTTMTFSRNAKLFTCSVLDQRTHFEPDFATPPQVSNSLQFYMSPPKAVYIVPPPSLLLNTPMLMQANLPLWLSIKDGSREAIWSQESELEQGGHDFSQIMELSMRQIENRLAENGIGKENIWKRQQKAACKEIHTPLNRINHRPLEGPMNLSSERAMTVSKVTSVQRILKGEILSDEHLRKAKLMFLYARYPNSAYLKYFFPEVTFNRYNTAQLVKWFSNFREFFYINVERYTRALVAEGVRSPELIRIMPKFGLYKTLIVHYNRGMKSETPAEFIVMVEMTVLEFFIAIITGADRHSAWKKKIYKTIALFDLPVPEHFRYLKCKM
ncbi:Homeobox protein prospero [Echinococcus granulosus]|uniref:Homeobox protein prospero n=2 Tax=Echinococcus granulosus TaxID=6210 RepID=W6VE50_ECHGR|nr:Homeobox protein prospero [Echinococcus granulosus]EUB65099.1 Homeobox protein prospero [Echinococcus granulosus]